MQSQSGPRVGDAVAAGAGAIGGLTVPLTGIGSLPGSFEGVGQLEQQLQTEVDPTGGVVPVKEVEGSQVVKAGVVVAQPCCCLSRGEDGVVDRLAFGAGAG